MLTTLTAERVRRDLEVVSRAGLDLDEFLREAVASLGRAVPHVSACAASVDPATLMLTGSRKFGDLLGRDERDREFGLLEYGAPEPTSFARIAAEELPARGLHDSTGGRTAESVRFTTFMHPYFGYGDELRLVFREERRVWGGVGLFRGTDDEPFSHDEVEFAASLSSTFAAGVRVGLLTRFATTAGLRGGAGAVHGEAAPTVVMFDADDRLTLATPGAVERLAALGSGEEAAEPPLDVVAGLVASARRYARGEIDSPPRSRIRARDGRWYVLHASPFDAPADDGGAAGRGLVVVTIEEARPPDIVPLVVAAFGLTPRERDVTALVLQGADTKTIAQTLHLSAYTVQDHLKTIFDKANVRSRRELFARVYVDQYAPRPHAAARPDGSLIASPAGPA